MQVLGWDLKDTLEFLEDVRAELHDPKVHLYVKFYFVYGQKPE